MNVLLLSLLAVLALTIAVVTVPALRRPLLTGFLLQKFRRVMPAMSSTEQEALGAGGIWWDAELFSGRPRWRRLLDLPCAQLSAEEEAFLAGPVERLCRMLDDWQITQHDLDLPPQVWELIRRERFFGLVIPQRYGGLGFSPLAHSQVVMKIASRSITAAVTVMVPNSLGPAELLLRYGTEAQRSRYLPRLARGQEIPCFALTGPRAGSDAAAIPDEGVVCYGDLEGRRVLGIRLDFEKRYITLAPVATLIGLAFRLRDPDRLLGEDQEPGITLALIPAGTPGVEQGDRHLALGHPFQNGPLFGRNVFIPLDWVIGGRSGIGKGWRMLMESLAEGRGISLPALATGAGKLASRFTGAYARVRQQFGRAIGDFEGVEEPLARIAGRTYQMDAARRVFLSALAAGERPAVLSAVLKYHLTHLHRLVVNDAMDIQGGSGICVGPRNLLGRIYQGVPIAITVEGANILTRSLIIFGQGAVRCHPHLLEEVRAAHEPGPGRALRRFDAAVISHLGFLARNLLRTLRLGLTRGQGSGAPGSGGVRRYYQRLNWMSSAFALNADLAMMTLGGSLKRRERLSARLGDVLSLLFLASAALKQFEDQGRHASDLPLLRWSLEDHLRGIQQAFLALWRNLPSRGLAWLLRTVTFPTGLVFRGPNDRLDHAIARLILEPGEVRDRLTEGIFVTRDAAFPTGRLEQALDTSVRAEEIDRALRKAMKLGRIRTASGEQALAEAVDVGLLRPDEVALRRRAEQLRDEVIRVDSFADLGTPQRESSPPVTKRHKSAA
ncbi:MAG: acyl-CoA dehydrogenase [Pseudomonadota bacterium]|nr:acyl-CoA dehydrogenase [Pseudomonadota bacterium]